jgi:hypothetical protein
MGAGTVMHGTAGARHTGHVIVLKYTCCQKQGVMLKGNDAGARFIPAQVDLFLKQDINNMADYDRR